MAEILDRDGVLNEIASKTKVPSTSPVCDSWVGSLLKRYPWESWRHHFGFPYEDALDLPP